MFGRSKVKVNSESGPSKFIHLFFGPLLAFPLPVIIIIAQLIIDIKVKDIKLEFICYSVEYFLKIIVVTFQNYENVHFYYFFLAVGIDLVSEDHWASKECLLKWCQLFKINWVFLLPPSFFFPSSLPSSLWYGLSFERLGQVHTSFKQTG